MTIAADLTLSALEHLVVISRMGRMAAGAFIFSRSGQMTVIVMHFFRNTTMTSQTDGGSVLLPAGTVAIIASIGKRSV